MQRSKIFVSLLFSLSIIAYIISLVIVKLDVDFDYRWIAFWLHIISLFIIFCIYLLFTVTFNTYKKLLSRKDIFTLIFILIIAGVVNFIFLDIYPYSSISDELRDNGLYAMGIASGEIKNIFEYGAYNAYGLIIPTITSLFYYIFGSSVLSYRVASVMFSIIGIVFVYLLIGKVINKQAGFWSAMVLTTLPLHMYFARSQAVVGFNFMWTPILLFLLSILLQKRRRVDYIFLGAIVGFVFGFHAAVRVIACFIVLVLFLIDFGELIFRKLPPAEWRNRFLKFLLVILFAFVGFGPRLLFTGFEDFFHTSRLSLGNNPQDGGIITWNTVGTIGNSYIRSLLAYFSEPVIFFYKANKPILSPFSVIFFGIGIYYSLFGLKKYFVNILLFFLVVLPFFISAITDWVNADHRYTPLLSLAAIFTGIGFSFVLGILRKRKFSYLLIILFSLNLLWQVVDFYHNRPADKDVYFENHLARFFMDFLNDDPNYQAQPAVHIEHMRTKKTVGVVCFYVSPKNYSYFHNNVGISEMHQFLLPGVHVQFGHSEQIERHEVYIVKDYCSNVKVDLLAFKRYNITCPNTNKYICPLDYTGELTLFY